MNAGLIRLSQFVPEHASYNGFDSQTAGFPITINSVAGSRTPGMPYMIHGCSAMLTTKAIIASAMLLKVRWWTPQATINPSNREGSTFTVGLSTPTSRRWGSSLISANASNETA